MYNTEKFYVVTEANVGANDVINMANYTFTDENQAYSKLYRLWGYDANPEQGETRQLLSATLIEYSGIPCKAILKESKVFDRRQPEPEPEPEPNEE